MKKILALTAILAALVCVFTAMPSEAFPKFIGEKRALQIALHHARINQRDAKLIAPVDLVRNGKRMEYRVVFATRNNMQYDYRVEAVFGKVTHVSRKPIHNWQKPGQHPYPPKPVYPPKPGHPKP